MKELERLEMCVAAFVVAHRREKLFSDEDKFPAEGREEAQQAWGLRAEARELAHELSRAWNEYTHRTFCDSILAGAARLGGSEADRARQRGYRADQFFAEFDPRPMQHIALMTLR
jgi:hypothetical protein